MLSLDAPLTLLLLLLLPWMIWAVHFRSRRGGVLSFSFRWWKGEGYAPGFQIRRLLSSLAHGLLWLSAVVLIFALAGPAVVKRERVHLNRGLDIVILLDESPSMLAQDFKPDHRFGAAKAVIQSFVAGRENDAIGLVSFGQEAILRAPPTTDHNLVLETLSSLDIMGLGEGTAIGMGLSLAALHLRSSQAPGRVIILLTDGENNAGEISPEKAAAVAQDMGIRIYTVGIGREGDAVMELTDPKTGQVVRGIYRGRFDEELLERIAERTGGRYFHASSPGVLAAIFQEIDSIEKTEKRVKVVVNRSPLHTRFIALGLMLAGISFLFRKTILREML